MEYSFKFKEKRRKSAEKGAKGFSIFDLELQKVKKSSKKRQKAHKKTRKDEKSFKKRGKGAKAQGYKVGKKI